MTTSNSLTEKLQQASLGLLYMSEADYPYEVVQWDNPDVAAITEEFIRQKAEVADDTPVEEITFSDFYDPNAPAPDWYGEQEKEEAARYRSLLKILTDNLNYLKVYRIGEIEVDIYILGQSPDGDIIGLKTKAIET